MRLRLAELRSHTQLSQEDVANIAGVSAKTEWNWEKGKSYPNVAQAWLICEALGCTMNDLCGWYDEHPQDRPRASPLGPDEEALLGNYRLCSPERRRRAAQAVLDQCSLSQGKEAPSGSSDAGEGAA